MQQAVRAIRHPERYGPRARGRGTVGQSRARGLTRAILDTFPVVKFGGDSMAPSSSAELGSQHTPVKIVDQLGQSNSSNVESKELRIVRFDKRDTPQPKAPMEIEANQSISDVEHQRTLADSSPSESGPGSAMMSGLILREGFSGGVARGSKDVVPASIGRETCPICIMDFEEGDDLRVLPCEGKHRFHKTCVDPWLLELSSSCPICREGN
ncbi:hypothetical protein C0992_009376 [Termitomyces sp. T32_za158]|nr:hypothetical protein C0992_009376 [Termitomyces sp. T32_za158]